MVELGNSSHINDRSGRIENVTPHLMLCICIKVKHL
jgi:hypothetical protein